MILGAWTPLQWLALVEHELLLFAGVFFLIGSIDELAIDFAWLGLWLNGRARTLQIRRENHCGAPLAGPAALIIPAWREEGILATTIAHALAAWPQLSREDLRRLYRPFADLIPPPRELLPE